MGEDKGPGRIAMNAPTPEDTRTTRRRWRWLTGALGAVLVLAASYGLYWAQVTRYRQSTDDAYVGGNVVEITPQISGTLVAIGAHDTQFARAGERLARHAEADTRVAPRQADAPRA